MSLVLRWESGRGFLDDLYAQAMEHADLARLDRKLIQELAYGTIRWRLTLDWLINRYTQSRTQKLALRVLLRLGLYQLFWLSRIPDHALVHETVEGAKRLGFGPQAGFINALLRRYIRERDQTKALLEELKSSDPALGFSHPAWLWERWNGRWGGEAAQRLLGWNNQPAPTFARVNTLKIQRDQLLALWEKEGVRAKGWEADWLPPARIYEVEDHPPFQEWNSFQKGFFYIQDPSTLLSVEMLQLQPGHQVLDLCAAPGGKTTYAAQLMQDRGKITARDLDETRLELVSQNCARLGIRCVEVEPGSTTPPESAAIFDRVLIDAPCSNSGVMRRRVDLRWRITPAEIVRLRKVQENLLCQGARQVKPGGLLVYSSCSLEPEENQEVIGHFLAEREDYRLEKETQLVPFRDGIDGAYAARLKRLGVGGAS